MQKKHLKSLQRINGKDVITASKTEKGKRVIMLPDFLVTQLEDYINKLYGMTKKDRLFMITKSYLEHEMKTEYLALAVTIVDIVNGAAYLFDKKAPDREQLWKESLEREQY